MYGKKTQSDIEHKWAHQVAKRGGGIEGRKGNIFYDGPSIYSYGRHFEMARIVTIDKPSGIRGSVHPAKAVLITTRRYSVSTARHINDVRRAVSHMPTFNVPDLGASPRQLFDSYKARIADALKNADKASAAKRVASKAKEHWELRQVSELTAQANELARFFGLRMRLKLPKGFENRIHTAHAISLEYSGQLAAQRDKKYAGDRCERAIAERTELEPKWRAGQNVYFRHRYYGCAESLFAWLRVSADGTAVETSQGASAPIDHVRRAYQYLAPLVARGENWRTNGKTIHVGDFTVDSLAADGTVRAGCHTFEWSEIEALATAQGWNKANVAV